MIFGPCNDPLTKRSPLDINCLWVQIIWKRNVSMFHVSVIRYAPNKLSKIAWKQIENGAPELFIFLQTFSFHVDEYELMIEYYAEKLRSGQSSMFNIACDWLNHEVPDRWKLALAFYRKGLTEIFPRYKNNETITWYENWEGFIYRYLLIVVKLQLYWLPWQPEMHS